MPRTPPHDPIVYVVRSDKSGLLKIGTTTNLSRRLGELSRLTKGAVTLVLRLSGDATLERHLHARCAADLVAGEWFRPSPAVLSLVDEARLALSPDRGRPFASVAPLPPWVAVALRTPLLPACACVRSVGDVAYARGTCFSCHGAGVLPRAATTEAA